MKIRIKGPSIRIRLTKSEVALLVAGNPISDYTPFPVGAFRYTVQPATHVSSICASFEDGQITMMIPPELLAGWDTDDRISLEGRMPLNDTEQLHLLVEKDFKCLDVRDDEQRDYYDNPSENC